VWVGSDQEDDPKPPKVPLDPRNAAAGYCVYLTRGEALCSAHDCKGAEVIELDDEQLPPATVESLRQLIADDVWASNFKTLKAYRDGLLQQARI
jgi:hypothetical protein